MRTYQQQYLYQQLELIESSTATSNPFPQRLLEMVQGIWTRFGKVLTSSEEPQFWELLDKNGQIYWKVYDPATSRIFYLDSLQSVLEWIEERHYPASQASSFFAG